MSSDGTNLRSQVQRLARNAFALATGGVVAQLCFTLLEVLIARRLGADTYGIFVTAYAWTVLGSLLIGLGMPLWAVQEGSRRHEQIPSLLASGLAVNGVIFLALYALIAVIAHYVVADPIVAFLLILLPYGLVLATQNTLGAVFSTFQTMHVNALFQSLAPLVILLIYFMRSARELSLNDVALAYVAGGLIVTGLWLVYTVWKVRPEFGFGKVVTALRSSYQYALTSILGQVYYKVDVIMLAALAGIHEAGIYAAAFKLVELVYKVAVLMGRVFSPVIFKASHAPGKTFEVFASMMTRFMAVAGLVAGVLTFVLAEELILAMFGTAYAESIPVLQVMGGVMASRCMMVALQLLLSSIDRHAQRTKGLALAVAGHVAANLLLIPAFGAPGAAWAALFSGTSLVLVYALFSSGRPEFNFRQWLLVPSALAVVVALATLWADVSAVIQAAAALAILLAGLFAMGFVRRDEIRFVLHSVLAQRSP